MGEQAEALLPGVRVQTPLLPRQSERGLVMTGRCAIRWCWRRSLGGLQGISCFCRRHAIREITKASYD